MFRSTNKYARAMVLARLMLALACAFLVTPYTVWAETETAALRASIESAVETKVSEVLSHYLETSQFSVAAVVTLKPQTPAPSLPHIDNAATMALAAGRPLSGLSEYIQDLKIEILIAKTFTEPEKRSLSRILEQRLRLPKEIASIRMTPTDFPEIKTQGELTAKLLEKQTELLESSKRLEKLEGDLKTLERQISESKQSTPDAKTDDAPASDANPGSPDTGTAKGYTFIALVGLGAMLLILGFLGMIFSARILARSFSGSSQTIATSLAKGRQGADTTGASVFSAQNPVQPISTSNAPAAQAPSNAISESTHERLQELRTQILERLDPDMEQHLVRQLVQDIASEHHLERAVLTLELLGPEKTKSLFKQLDTESSARVLRFLKTGSFSGNKLSMMVEAGELLVTRLLAFDIDQAADGRSAFRKKLLATSTDDLRQLLEAIDINLAPRLMLNIEPGRLAKIIAKLRVSSPDRYSQLVEMLPRIADYASLDHLDHEIDKMLPAKDSGGTGGSGARQMEYYDSFLNAADQDTADQLTEALRARTPALRRYIDENFVSTSMLLRINDTLREQLLASLTNKEAAAVIYWFKDTLRHRIEACIPRDRMEYIREEITILADNPHDIRTRQAVKNARQLVNTKLLALRKNGMLEEISELDERDNASPEPAASLNKVA